MADVGEQEAQLAGEGESPGIFLAYIGDALRKKEDVDIALVEILAQHLLTAAPTPDAVAKARDLILKLAGERAMLKPDANDA